MVLEGVLTVNEEASDRVGGHDAVLDTDPIEAWRERFTLIDDVVGWDRHNDSIQAIRAFISELNSGFLGVRRHLSDLQLQVFGADGP